MPVNGFTEGQEAIIELSATKIAEKVIAKVNVSAVVAQAVNLHALECVTKKKLERLTWMFLGGMVVLALLNVPNVPALYKMVVSLL